MKSLPLLPALCCAGRQPLRHRADVRSFCRGEGRQQCGGHQGASGQAVGGPPVQPCLPPPLTLPAVRPPPCPCPPSYLNTVEEGGETVFPNIPAPGGDNGPSFSDCARKHLAAKPTKGSAGGCTHAGCGARRPRSAACGRPAGGQALSAELRGVRCRCCRGLEGGGAAAPPPCRGSPPSRAPPAPPTHPACRPPPAVLFHSMTPAGELEKRSLHTAW